MFMSPMRDVLSSCGGGAITPGCERKGLCKAALTCGGGAIACDDFPRLLPEALFSSGGGGTTLASVGGSVSLGLEETSGTGAMRSAVSGQATILGRGTFSANLTAGGTTIVCSRLSLSLGTEIIVCGA